MSLFDAVSSLFMAMILFIGSLVFVLFMVWLLDAESEPTALSGPPLRGVSSSGSRGVELDFVEPSAEEVEALLDPSVALLLEAITQEASRLAAGDFAVAGEAQARGGSGEDGREPGPDNGDQDGDGTRVPRFDRWELQFSARSYQAYARQLDDYQIELGAVGGGVPGVDYAFDFVAGPKSRHGEPAAERRLYFLWNRPSPLQQYDYRLLSAAGVELSGRQMIKFIPEELENRLAAIELEYARSSGRAPREIAKTVFESRMDSGEYRFVVVSQRYRKARP